MKTSLPRGASQEQGVGEDAILRLIDSVERLDLDAHSLMIVRHGQVIAEGWWDPYQAEENHLLYSLTKSFTSTAVGFAVAEGLFGLDDLMVDLCRHFLPETVSENLSRMKVRHLLSMSVGHAEEPFLNVRSCGWKECLATFLAHDVPFEPGTHFLYNTAASNVLSILIQLRTGELLSQFIRPRLLAPLGVEGERWSNFSDFDWGGSGLYTSTETIAKLGLLYLNDGKWEGRQLLPDGWAELASKYHVANGDEPNNDWNQGYGFQFWRCRHGAFRGDGAFGQYCVVMPAQDAVFAMTSSTGDMQSVLDAVWNDLLPGFDNGSSPSGALKQKLSKLSVGPAAPAPKPIVIENQEEGFLLDVDESEVHLKLGEGLRFGLAEWQRISYGFGDGEARATGIKIFQMSWGIEVKICDLSSPQVQIVRIKLDGGAATVEFRDTGTFFPMPDRNFTASIRTNLA